MKKEFLLSFNNQEKKRNKEYLFSFKYNSILKNYYLIYQREYVILSIECFKDLASLFKKAARSFSLCDTFLTHFEKFRIHNDSIKIKMEKPVSMLPVNNFLYNIHRNLFYRMPEYTFINLFNISAGHGAQYDNIVIKTIYPFYFTKYYDNLYLKRDKDDLLSLYDNLYLKRDKNNKGYIYNSNIFLKDFNYCNIFDEYRADLNIYDYLDYFNEVSFLKNLSNRPRIKRFDNIISVYAPNHDRKSMFRFNNIDLLYKIRIGMIRNSQKNLYRNTNYNTTENITEFLLQPYKITNFYENIHIQLKTYIYNVFKYYLIKTNNKNNTLNLYENIFTTLDNKTLNAYSIINTYKIVSRYSSLNVFENVFTTNEKLYLNHFSNDYAKTNDSKLNIYSNEFSNVNDKFLYAYSNDLINKSSNGQLVSSFTIESFNTINKNLFFNNIYSFSKTLKYSQTYSNNNFVNTDNSKITYLYEQNNFVNKFNKNAYIYNICRISDNAKYMYLYDTQSFTNKTSNNDKLNEYILIFVNKYNKNIEQIQSNNFVINNTKRSYLQLNDLVLYKNHFKINIFNNNNFINKSKSFISLYDKYDSYFTSKNFHLLSSYETESFINKSYKKLLFFSNNIFINKCMKNTKLNNLIDSFIKIQFKLFNEQNYIDIYKKYKNIKYFSNLNNNFVYKVPYYLYRQKDIRNIALESKPIRLYTDQFFTSKVKHKLKTINSLFGIFKEYKVLKREDANYYDVLKYAFPLAILNIDDKVIVPVTKIDRSTFCRDIYDFIYKKYKNTNYLNIKEVSGIKIIRDTFEIDPLICDKLALNTSFLTLLNDSIIRSKIQTYYIDREYIIHKVHFDILLSETINSYRIPRKVYTLNDIIFKKIVNNIFLLDNEHIIKKYRTIDNYPESFIEIQKYLKGYEFNNEQWANVYKLSFIHNSPTVFKIINEAFKHSNDRDIDNEEEFLYKVSRDIDYTNFEWQYLEIVKKSFLANSLLNNIRSNYQAFYYDNVLADKNIVFGQVPEIDEITKCIHEADISSDEIVDWAWVYQEDEGFDDPFKIDELLLPENDTRYEDFENIIFNRETLTPRNPVKIIDDTTFIAKFPNHYPIKDENNENAYKNIAVDYLEVRTGIMRQVFIGYYKLWQDNIFEFAKMTIPQSAKKILDYLYTWILMYFPEEDIPEALRSFRLIRWYLERSIIECSEYYISYNPDDLTSGKMDTTILDIPNDLNPLPEYIDYMDPDYLPQNTTMLVDTNLHVIKNDPMQLDKDAHITFFIENKKNTSISFYLNTYTPVSIILNGKVIDSITLPTSGKMVYNIPYTEDVNVFTISKKREDNTDNYFFIGNVVIRDMGKTGELDISFNPIIKGNKVLNHTSKKILSYMNLYEDNETLIQNLKKGNIHLNELYDKLLTYWELHHQEKDKGKRWMIKRT